MFFKYIAWLLLLALSVLAHKGNQPTVTLISGFWDVGRGALNNGFKRTNEYYLGYFQKWLQTESNMIIFGDATLMKFVAQKRKNPNTLFILRDLESFRQRWHTPKILKIIQDFKGKPVWGNYGQYPQYNLDMYNPVVMSKLFLMTEAIDQDIFNSDFFVWADAGLLHNYEQYQDSFVPKNVLESFQHIFQGPWYFHIYSDPNMFRGYDQTELRYMKNKVPSNQMVLANYFGGRIQVVSTMKAVYQNFLRITLDYGDLGTDESVFSMMLIRFPYLIPLINSYEMREFANRYKIQSKHYLSYEQHRLLRMKANGQHQVEHLTVKKREAQRNQIKENFDKTDKEETKFEKQPVKIIPSSQNQNLLKPSPQYPETIIPIDRPFSGSSIPALLSQTIVNYKFMLIHRVIYAFITLGLYFYIIKQKHFFRVGSHY